MRNRTLTIWVVGCCVAVSLLVNFASRILPQGDPEVTETGNSMVHLLVGLVSTLSGNTANAAGMGDGDAKTAVVIIEDQGGAAQSIGPAEALVISSMKEAKVRVLERSLLDQLKKDELLQGAIRNRNASFFREIGIKYQTNLIVYLTISADAERSLGRHWIAAAVVSGYMASTKSAEILSSGTSPAMGTPGFPTVVGDTAFEAKDRAVRICVGGVLTKFGLPSEVGVIPTDLRINLSVQWKKTFPDFVVTSAAFGPSGNLLAGGLSDGTVQVWGVQQGESRSQTRPHSSAIAAVTFSPDEKLLATGGEDERVALTELPSGRAVATWSVGDKVSALSFSPNGLLVAGGTSDGRVILFHVSGTLPVQTVQGHEKRVNFLSFSRDGRQLITASDDLTVRFWNPQSFSKPLRIMREDIFRGQISRGALSTDGEFLALATKEIDIDRLRNLRTDTRKVRLIQTLTGEEIHHFRAHEKDISALAFGASRRILASGAEDGDLKIWDAERGREISRLSFGQGALIHALAFSRDGQWIAGSVGDTLMLWKVD